MHQRRAGLIEQALDRLAPALQVVAVGVRLGELTAQAIVLELDDALVVPQSLVLRTQGAKSVGPIANPPIASEKRMMPR